MINTKWSNLNQGQLNKFAKAYALTALLSNGVDVQYNQLNNKNYEFNMKCGDRNFEIQIRSFRENTNYVFVEKRKFDVNDPDLMLGVVYFNENHMPKVYLIPSEQWKNENELFRDRPYEGLKSEAEWGLNVSNKNLHMLEEFQIEKILEVINK